MKNLLKICFFAAALSLAPVLSTLAHADYSYNYGSSGGSSGGSDNTGAVIVTAAVVVVVVGVIAYWIWHKPSTAPSQAGSQTAGPGAKPATPNP